MWGRVSKTCEGMKDRGVGGNDVRLWEFEMVKMGIRTVAGKFWDRGNGDGMGRGMV